MIDQLDVYYPPAVSALSTPNRKLPVLFFIYGGGYSTGWKRYAEPYEMGYRSVGAFFAKRGFLTVIPDYRLSPNVQFPAASEDVHDALLWVAEHATEVAAAAIDPASTRAELDLDCAFIMGHSAGSAHTLTLFSHPPSRASFDERAAEVGLRVRALVMNGTPFYFDVPGETYTISGPVYYYYFEDKEQQKEKDPRGLWANLGEEYVRTFPEVFLVQGEWEPEWLRFEVREVMENEMREKFRAVGRDLQKTYVAAGHNHISTNWALSTGDEEGEKWGYGVAEWIKARI